MKTNKSESANICVGKEQHVANSWNIKQNEKTSKVEKSRGIYFFFLVCKNKENRSDHIWTFQFKVSVPWNEKTEIKHYIWIF